MTTGALARVVRRASTGPSAEAGRCELCAVDLPEQHAHLWDERNAVPVCACRACALLFQPKTDVGGGFLPIPERRLRLDGVSPGDLGVPVGLAFFVRRLGDGSEETIDAHYPSPAGATQWQVAKDLWDRAVARCPELRSLRADVEAVLVNTVRGDGHAWIVPITDCHRLVAIVRTHWSGMFGGTRVWQETDRFFEELSGRETGGDHGRDQGR